MYINEYTYDILGVEYTRVSICCIRKNKYIWLFFNINDRDSQDHESLQMLRNGSWHYSVKYEKCRGGGVGTSDPCTRSD
jgi:hypothetical protein